GAGRGGGRARHRDALRAGGAGRRRGRTEFDPAVDEPDLDLLALNEALDKLEAQDKRKADLVKLRFFTGLTIEEAAQVLGVATSTADKDWAYARCWLRLEMEGDPGDELPCRHREPPARRRRPSGHTGCAARRLKSGPIDRGRGGWFSHS